IQRMGSVVVRHTFMEQNRVADQLAKEAAKEIFLCKSVSLAVPPVFATDIFWADIPGTELPRSFLGCNLSTIMQNYASLGALKYPSN
ncbi:hypothetical protein A4A49_61306, partial [Nicotiana attenuata]